jgi:hypothetical protein
VRKHLLSALVPLGCVIAISRPLSADNFGPSYYDAATNELVVTMLYGGTNPNHKFTIKWGVCQFDDSGLPPARQRDSVHRARIEL